jgi:FKBP-type peptidyl-prolyl cis-trans isomerase
LSFAPALGVNLDEMIKTASGLYYRDLVVGEGAEVQVGSAVTVHYTGWLHDGTLLDSSRTFDDPFTFTVGAGEVIQGWDEGLQGMKVGGERKLVIPSHLAYGSKQSGPVPPYATLVFDVELLEVVNP